VAQRFTIKERILSTTVVSISLGCILAAVALFIHGFLGLVFGWTGWVARPQQVRLVFPDFFGGVPLLIAGYLLLRLGLG